MNTALGHDKLTDALTDLYRASALLGDVATDADVERTEALRAVRAAEAALERQVALAGAVSRASGNKAALLVDDNDVASARRALDAAVERLARCSPAPADQQLDLLRGEVDDIAGRLAAVVTRLRFQEAKRLR